MRHRRAKLGPDQPVADDQHRAEYPPEHRLRPAHRRDDQRHRDERPDADHVDHVERRRTGHADAADQFVWAFVCQVR